MKPSHQIAWFVEMRGVTVRSRDGRVCCSIPSPYAGLWALIANGNHDPEYAIELMSVLLSVSPEMAEAEVARTIAAWKRTGLLSDD